MTTLNFKSERNLKKAIKNELSNSKILSINGYEISVLSLDVTNKNVSVYDIDTQSNIYFSRPFAVTVK